MKKWCLLLLLTGCHAALPENHDDAVKMEIDEIPDDIKIPTKLWDEIQEIPDAARPAKGPPAEGAKKEEGAAEEEVNPGTVLFSPVTVILKEHNPGTLNHSEFRIQLPRGGGKIDFAPLITDSRGSFFVRFEFPEWTELKDVRSFYVSRARKRKIEGELYGVGCNKYLEFTHHFQRDNVQSGIKVNTTRDLETTVLGGHLVFSLKNGSQTFLTQVTFADSKNPQLFCEANSHD